VAEGRLTARRAPLVLGAMVVLAPFGSTKTQTAVRSAPKSVASPTRQNYNSRGVVTSSATKAAHFSVLIRGGGP
jgi:hypothetical protein